MLKKLIVGIIAFVMVITSVISSVFVFAESPKDFKIEGSHKIENINSGTRNIILESEDTGNKSTKTIEVNGKFEFNVSLPNIGTYKYKLYQEPITAEGLTQDNSTYFIECYVRNEENVLIIKDKNGNKIDKIEFVDTYVEPPVTPEPEPEPEPEPQPEPEPEEPWIKTSLTDKNGNKKIELNKKVFVIDTITYGNLVEGKKYEVLGVLMDKDTNKPTNITSSNTFTIEKGKEKGTAQVIFEFDSTKYEGKTLVAFETLYEVTNSESEDVIEVAEHRDINDKEQTITINKKSIIERITPKTGDSNNILIMLVISILAMIGLIPIIKKRKSYNKN